AERTSAEHANRRRIVRIKIRELSRTFRNSARRLQAEAKVQCQRPRNAEVVLDESERIQRKVMQMRIADELLIFKRIARLEISEAAEQDDALCFCVKEARRLVAVDVHAPLQRVTSVRPRNRVGILKRILRASLRNN